MRKTVFKVLRGLSIVLFLIVAIIILFYPFQNRDLRVLVETEGNEYVFELSESDINSSNQIEFKFPDESEIVIKQIDLYGDIKSICLKKIEYNKLLSLIDLTVVDEYEQQKDGLNIANREFVRLVLNQNGKELFMGISQSRALERLCIIEGVLVFFMILFVVFSALEEKYDVNNRNNHGPIYEWKRFWNDLRKYRNYIAYAAKTDLKAEVANSYLNRLWWLLEPLFNMLVYVIVFGGVMGRSIKQYPIFVFSALLMWNFFSKTINYSVKLVRNNKDIVTKVYVPKFVLLISNMCLNFYKLLFSLIILFSMMIIFKVQIGIEVLMVIPAYVIMILFAFGVGMIFLHYGVYVDDLSYAVGILLSMLMFLSGTFYEVMTTLSDPINTIIICLNPLAVVIDTMRNALIYGNVVNIPLLVIWFLISVIVSCIGVHIVYKNENGYVKVV